MKTISIFMLLLAVPAVLFGRPPADCRGDQFDERRYVNYYEGKTVVDDGFGGVWNVQGMQEFPPDEDITYYLRRPSNNYPGGMREFYGNLRKLPLHEKSRSPESGAYRAFWGYLTELWDESCTRLTLHLWVDTQTGRIKEVGYEFYYNPDFDQWLAPAIPPKNFSIYERILKRTVRFDVSGMEYTEQEKEFGYCCLFYFMFPWPERREPKLMKRVPAL